jgi:hypothetical protein
MFLCSRLLAILLSLSASAATPHTKAVAQVVIRPKVAPAPPETSGFRVTRMKDGNLSLSFFSRDSRLHLDPTGPFVIQFNTLGVFDVEPSVITGTEWPQRPKPLTLKLKNLAPGKKYSLAGAAAYNLCGPAPKSCRKVKSEIHYTIVN